jgi:hypothetical protein
MPYNEARSEATREANRRRAGCSKCGSTNVYFADGSKCDGLPGLIYKVCPGCGNASATKRKSVKEQL